MSSMAPFPRRDANDNGIDPTPPQPGLRAFIVYDELPSGCVAFEVPNNNAAPHLRAGDFVVIDPDDREPVEGELFAITWKSALSREWQIVQMNAQLGPWSKGDTREDDFRWFIGAPAPERMRNLAGQPVGKPLRWGDGPYKDEYCREITHGRVVGFYEPDFRAQMRRA